MSLYVHYFWLHSYKFDTIRRLRALNEFVCKVLTCVWCLCMTTDSTTINNVCINLIKEAHFKHRYHLRDGHKFNFDTRYALQRRRIEIKIPYSIVGCAGIHTWLNKCLPHLIFKIVRNFNVPMFIKRLKSFQWKH